MALADRAAIDAALVGERFERRDDDRLAVDLEVVTQRVAAVAASEAVRAEHDVAARAPIGGSGRTRSSCSPWPRRTARRLPAKHDAT